MKCCSIKKALLVTAIVGLGVFLVGRTSWGEFGWHKFQAMMKKQVSPETRLEKARLDIAKLDKEIEKNWTPIAEEEQSIKALKKDVDSLRSNVDATEAELLAAAADLKAGVTRVKFRGEKSAAEARRALVTEANSLASKKHEMEFKEKELASKEEALSAAMATQEEMFRQRTELDAEVSALEAELKVVKLEESRSKFVLHNGSKLDEIKGTLADIRKDIEVRKRVNTLRKTHPTGESNVEKAKEFTNEEVIKKINSVVNKGKDLGDGQ